MDNGESVTKEIIHQQGSLVAALALCFVGVYTLSQHSDNYKFPVIILL